MSQKNNPLAAKFQLSSLVKFAAPTMAMMVFMGLYTITDTIFVSRFVNTDALSAINIVTPVIYLIVGIASMLGTGASAVIARKMGAGHPSEARADFSLIILVGILTGLCLLAVGLIFFDPLLKFLGASPLLIPYCRDYLGLLLIFTPASILQTLFSVLFVTAGKPGIGMTLGISAGLANIILDYLFIVHCHMGIKGAALATGIGYMMPAITGIVWFLFNKKQSLYLVKPSTDLRLLLHSSLNGSSEMVSQLSSALTTLLFNLIMMRHLGEEGVAAITIIVYTQFFLNTLYMGFSLGTAPIISYNFGQKNKEQLTRLLKTSIFFILICSLLITLTVEALSPALIRLFAPGQTTVYSITLPGFRLFAISFLFAGFNIYTSAACTALSNGKISALIAFSRTFLFITAFLLILPRLIGIPGIFLAIPTAEIFSTILAIIFLKKSVIIHT